MKTSGRFFKVVPVCALLLAGWMASAGVAQDKAKGTKAATLDATAAKSLTANRVWQIKKPRGPGYDYWSWKSDGSVCVRLGEKTGNCADTGRWKLNGERLCYELTWWGEVNGLKSACFRISDLGKGHYAWLMDSEMNIHDFSLVE